MEACTSMIENIFRAYDRVWHATLMVKLWRMGKPMELLKMADHWRENRKASCYFAFTFQLSPEKNDQCPLRQI